MIEIILGVMGRQSLLTVVQSPVQSGTCEHQFKVAIALSKSYLVLSPGNAAESDKRDLMAELDTMKQLKPHPHVIKLLGCVTESGELILAAVYFIRV